uniref:Uncharacterized protein n=1 Tax=Arundo donax TaxID=35708 RepID=A0A0A9CFY1_ARUDO
MNLVVNNVITAVLLYLLPQQYQKLSNNKNGQMAQMKST